ncbi:DNA polymerase III subunit epsilon [Bifidobacterium ramosum]|uniref:DNA polymerase III subunit epsilon n=1 Tax=Bifidobacterium ramosum TaxID=1798158 RepID=A0A6L4WYK0_9BIFI|nr:DNA polymerase III subunit epsilon [Bifidobacterium ramosum]
MVRCQENVVPIPSLNRSWLDEALDDIDQWMEIVSSDAQGRRIDWDVVRMFDLVGGIGAGEESDLRPGANSDLHLLLARDYAIRNMVESILAQCHTAFMTDFDRIVSSYRLPRALAYANRRLNDEIQLLVDRGTAEGYWTVSHERRGRDTVIVLHPTSYCPFSVDDIQDDTAVMQKARAAYRAQRNATHCINDTCRATASPHDTGSLAVPLISDGDHRFDHVTDPRRYEQSDWRDEYLPGRDVDKVMGIDIETTGIDPARAYIIDVGFEYMNMHSPPPNGRAERLPV